MIQTERNVLMVLSEMHREDYTPLGLLSTSLWKISDPRSTLLKHRENVRIRRAISPKCESIWHESGTHDSAYTINLPASPRAFRVSLLRFSKLSIFLPVSTKLRRKAMLDLVPRLFLELHLCFKSLLKHTVSVLKLNTRLSPYNIYYGV